MRIFYADVASYSALKLFFLIYLVPIELRYYLWLEILGVTCPTPYHKTQSSAGHVGTNTELLTEENNSLKWIGPNTHYLTEVVATTTISGTPVTATQAIQVLLVGPVATDGAPITDFDIVISPSFLGELNGLREEFCTFVKKRSGTCGIEFGRRVLTAYEAQAVAAGAAAAGTGAAGGIFAAIIQKMVEEDQEIPHKIHISHEDYLKATPTGSVVTVIAITRTTLTSVQTAIPTTLLNSALPSSSSSSTTGGSGPNGPNSGSAQDPEATLYPSCWLYTGPDIQHSTDDTYKYAFDDDFDPLNLHGIDEVSILKEFFDLVFLTPLDPRCQSFIALFLRPNTNPDTRAPDSKVMTRLQSLWDQGASKQNKAFLGMDEAANSPKGKMFNRNLDEMENVHHPGDSPQGMSWSVLHFPIAAEQFRKVNNAIYRGFLAFDLIQTCNPDDAPASVIQHVASVTSAIAAVPSATENSDHSKTMEGFAFDELAAVFNDDFWNLDIVNMLQLD
ncbi:hypothetical protein DL95DRAFT_459185 [Leptodontidium sp. 2 PMI_412]|nr:hypothetical protein DL95DRAFT_459185 [Leptodontidium sp. 2 PMI_412]